MEKAAVRDLAREELRAKMDRGDGFVLLDALPQEHYASSHVSAAANLPYEFVDDAEKVLPDKAAEVVVYRTNVECEATEPGTRELVEMGYGNVLHYEAGKQGLPGRPSPRRPERK